MSHDRANRQPVERFFFTTQKIPRINGQVQGGLDDAGTLIGTVVDYTAADLFTQSNVEWLQDRIPGRL
jgi:hypothetical protein